MKKIMPSFWPLRILLSGIAVGFADLVPGVSGATVAYLFGVYTELLHTLSLGARCVFLLVRLKFALAWQLLSKINWLFACLLFAGILIALFGFAPAILWLIDVAPHLLFGFFFGMVVVISSYMVRSVVMDKTWRTCKGRVFVLFVFGLFMGLSMSLIERGAIQEDPKLMFVCFAAMCAMCAMLLPGISGSFVLLLFGAYSPIIEAVATRNFSILLPVAISMLLAVVLFSHFLHWVFMRYQILVVAFFSGLLFGGLVEINPWDKKEIIGVANLWVIVCIIIGIGLAYFIHRIPISKHDEKH